VPKEIGAPDLRQYDRRCDDLRRILGDQPLLPLRPRIDYLALCLGLGVAAFALVLMVVIATSGLRDDVRKTRAKVDTLQPCRL
jgi:hypothetical protein